MNSKLLVRALNAILCVIYFIVLWLVLMFSAYFIFGEEYELNWLFYFINILIYIILVLRFKKKILIPIPILNSIHSNITNPDSHLEPNKTLSKSSINYKNVAFNVFLFFIYMQLIIFLLSILLLPFLISLVKTNQALAENFKIIIFFIALTIISLLSILLKSKLFFKIIQSRMNNLNRISDKATSPQIVAENSTNIPKNNINNSKYMFLNIGLVIIYSGIIRSILSINIKEGDSLGWATFFVTIIALPLLQNFIFFHPNNNKIDLKSNLKESVFKIPKRIFVIILFIFLIFGLPELIKGFIWNIQDNQKDKESYLLYLHDRESLYIMDMFGNNKRKITDIKSSSIQLPEAGISPNHKYIAILLGKSLEIFDINGNLIKTTNLDVDYTIQQNVAWMGNDLLHLRYGAVAPGTDGPITKWKTYSWDLNLGKLTEVNDNQEPNSENNVLHSNSYKYDAKSYNYGEDDFGFIVYEADKPNNIVYKHKYIGEYEDILMDWR